MATTVAVYGSRAHDQNMVKVSILGRLLAAPCAVAQVILAAQACSPSTSEFNTSDASAPINAGDGAMIADAGPYESSVVEAGPDAATVADGSADVADVSADAGDSSDGATSCVVENGATCGPSSLCCKPYKGYLYDVTLDCKASVPVALACDGMSPCIPHGFVAECVIVGGDVYFAEYSVPGLDSCSPELAKKVLNAPTCSK